MVLIPLLFIDI